MWQCISNSGIVAIATASVMDGAVVDNGDIIRELYIGSRATDIEEESLIKNKDTGLCGDRFT